jgi:hypothetical protein
VCGLQAFDAVSYIQLRRYLCRSGEEAVAAFLEDVCTYHDLRAPGSRLKWYVAPVAVVLSASDTGFVG